MTSFYQSPDLKPLFTFVNASQDRGVDPGQSTKSHSKPSDPSEPSESDSVHNSSEPQLLHLVSSWQPVDPQDKPPYSYATLIAHAILSSPNRKLTLSEIYHWITDHYPYYTAGEHGWQNSIRHNLSLNKAFVKLDRTSSKTTLCGKGSHWTIRLGSEQPFIDNLVKRRGPIRKQPVALDRSVLHRRSRRYPDSDKDAAHRASNSPLFTTFRMSPIQKAKKIKRSKPSIESPLLGPQPLWNSRPDEDNDSDCDSGVDVRNDFLPKPTAHSVDSDGWIQTEQSWSPIIIPANHPSSSSTTSSSDACALLDHTRQDLSNSSSSSLSGYPLTPPGTHRHNLLDHTLWAQPQHFLNVRGSASLGSYSFDDEPCLLGLGTATASLIGSLDWGF